MILQHLCKLRCNLLCCFKFNQWLRNFTRMGACCCSEFDGEYYEAAGNLRNHILVDVQVVRFLKGTIFGRKIWFTSGFHFADLTRKLVFPSLPNFDFYMLDHQEFPTVCTRLFPGCSCHVGSTHESRRNCHRTRVLMKELLQWNTFLVWHLEGAALRTGNLDVSSDHGGGWCGLVVVGPGWFFEMTYMIIYDHISFIWLID